MEALKKAEKEKSGKNVKKAKKVEKSGKKWKRKYGKKTLKMVVELAGKC